MERAVLWAARGLAVGRDLLVVLAEVCFPVSFLVYFVACFVVCSAVCSALYFAEC